MSGVYYCIECGKTAMDAPRSVCFMCRGKTTTTPEMPKADRIESPRFPGDARWACWKCDGNGSIHVRGLTAIERYAQQEAERAESACDQLDDAANHYAELEEANDAALAENARLREALDGAAVHLKALADDYGRGKASAYARDAWRAIHGITNKITPPVASEARG